MRVVNGLWPATGSAAVCACLFTSGVAGAATSNASSVGDLQLEEVVVTGSRVVQNGDNMPTPVT